MEKTNRGFALHEFEDRHGNKCSLQKSSVATEDAIWLGVDDPKPLILASDAKRLGIETIAQVGWVPFHIPEEVLLHTRMHLSIDQVKELLPILQRFVETGEIHE